MLAATTQGLLRFNADLKTTDSLVNDGWIVE
jgi:hypothetical protein